MNMFDYINWRGDLDFKTDPFNEVDNLIMSNIVYVDLRGIIDFDDVMSIQKTATAYFNKYDLKVIESNKSFIAESPFLLRECGKVKRFKGLKIHHYVNNINLETTEQFSAMCIDLDDETTYISFCGTDDTIVGWKEDFQMSYQLVPSQIKAKEYLEKVIDKNRKYYIGGHSKGGNLALYACCKVNHELLNNVIHIYSNDGPGLSDEIFRQEEFENIKDRYTKILPYEDVIGYLFYHPCHTIVIKSNEFSIMQHQATSWQIMRNEFVKVDDISELSKRFADALNHLLTEISFQQREQLVTDFFNALYEAKIYNVSDVMVNPIPVLKRLLVAVHNMNADSKKIAFKFTAIIKEILDHYIADFNKKANQLVSQKLYQVKEGVDDFIDKIKK